MGKYDSTSARELFRPTNLLFNHVACRNGPGSFLGFTRFYFDGYLFAVLEWDWSCAYFGNHDRGIKKEKQKKKKKE
jgi:hypothetical protein